MQAKEASFLFMRSNISLEVPFFQRGYVWDNTNWAELIENLTDDSSSHYLGSIVLKSLGSRSGEVPRWSIIDGQQRLTTLSILVKACCDARIAELKRQAEQVEDDDIKAEIEYGINICQNINRETLFYQLSATKPWNQIKIKHSHIDAPQYEQVVKGILVDSIKTKELKESEKILQCYQYFTNYLSDKPEVATQLLDLLGDGNTNILVKIDLENNENEQAIFDTVNSAGVRLTSADTIKNAIYQKAIEVNGGNKEDVIELYNNTWKSIFLNNDEALKYWSTQRRIGRLFRDNLEVLLHCVALIKGFYEPDKHTMEALPKLYKGYIETKKYNEIEEFINELCDYAKIFKEFFYVPSKTNIFRFDEPIRKLLHILDICDITTFHSYVLKLLKDFDVINNQDNLPTGFVEEISKLETYVLRRVVCGTSTKNFNKICFALLKGNTSLVDEFNYPEAVIDDLVVKEKLRNITSNKIATLILFWIELYRRHKDSRYGKENDKELKYAYSLEHVMPQKWQTHWSIIDCPVMDPETNLPISQTEEAELLRSGAIYEIGNMAILNANLNSALKNHTIKAKIEGPGGRTKGIRHYVAGVDVDVDVIDAYDKNVANNNNINPWNEFEIRQRTKKLEKEFITIWKAY